ncbi:HNH endonuclease signature motif containing protein [Streptomyces niveus]|uniref:HNH endonuclease n=1 Tax=Streptomyces niveus TaxID=193462 RepID=UPI00341038E4
MEYSRQYLRSEKSRERHRGYDRDRYANNPERREYNLALAKKFRQENPDKMSDYVKKRRAKVTQVTVEDVDSQTVYERDNWTCGICGEPVDRLLKWPHEQYPSLDHITPISKGGEHSYANTQLAHLVCNMRKGARLDLTEAP